MKRLLLKARNKKETYFNKHISDSDDEYLSDTEPILDLENILVNSRYVFISYLSRGTFSSVWLVYDLVQFEFRSAKIYSDPKNMEEFSNEEHIFSIISDIQNDNINAYFILILSV